MGISNYPLCSNWYFPQERKIAVTTRRPDSVLSIKFNNQRTYQIFGCSVLRHNKYQRKKRSAKLILTLLVISGNVELNPEPTNIKYPCGECARAVKFGPAIAYDQCNMCNHHECAGITVRYLNITRMQQ